VNYTMRLAFWTFTHPKRPDLPIPGFTTGPSVVSQNLFGRAGGVFLYQRSWLSLSRGRKVTKPRNVGNVFVY
jgi:hypothetical protein